MPKHKPRSSKQKAAQRKATAAALKFGFSTRAKNLGKKLGVSTEKAKDILHARGEVARSIAGKRRRSRG